jgi:ABC-type transporter Mla subunit MlaD
MAAEQSYAKLGLFVVIGLAVMVATGLFFVRRMRTREVIPMVTFTTENVSGLDVSSQVRYRGVPVGTVSDIRVNPAQGRIEIDFVMFEDRLTAIGASAARLRHFTNFPAFSKLRAQVVGNPISGEAYLLLDLPPNPPPPPQLTFTPPENYVPSMPSPISSMRDQLPEILERAQATLETVRGIVARVPASMDRSDRFFTNVERILRDSQLPTLSADLRTFSRDTTGQIAQIRGDIEGLTGKEGTLVKFTEEARSALRDANVPASTKAAQTAAERTTLAVDDLRRSLSVIRDTLDQLRELSRQLEEQPESVVYGPRQPKGKSR